MKNQKKTVALCVDNTDYKASLVCGKVYRVVPDLAASKDGLLRVIDESGEDYLYHRSLFVFVELPKAVERKILTMEAAA